MEGKPIRCYTDDDKIPIAQKNDVLIVWDGSIVKQQQDFKALLVQQSQH
jgi:hypothetical protein